ncbi:hypothetical protein GOBAR_DD27879 [Gossypium barbadense]|nr:hypothetical protein GOBAR_DD27879 [Gossypium barbadense]
MASSLFCRILYMEFVKEKLNPFIYKCKVLYFITVCNLNPIIEFRAMVRLAVDAILMAEGAERKGHMGIKRAILAARLPCSYSKKADATEDLQEAMETGNKDIEIR